MNYYLIYGTSETWSRTGAASWRVNYCLVCGTSETGKHFAAGGDQVNYYLVCGTSETVPERLELPFSGELLLGLRYFRNHSRDRRLRPPVNYYLVCGTSET